MSKLVIIGASTGGPSHIKKILSSLPADFNASVVICQHMGDEFINTFASRMNHTSALNIKVAEDNEVLANSTVYITSKLSHISQRSAQLSFKVSLNTLNRYNPDIDELFISCAKFANSVEILACILTGIGDDGAKGLLALSQTSALCICESEESAVVYGMPLRAKEMSDKIKVQSLTQIIDTIQKFGA